jgi:hypothetical protein
MRNLMKIVLLLMGVALFAGSILAGQLPSPDPKILIAGGGGSTDLYGTTFSFTSNSSGGGSGEDYDFYNDSGEYFSNLSITTTSVFPNGAPIGPIDCDLDGNAYFSDCAVITNLNNTATILFYNTGDPGGVPYCEDGDAYYCEFEFSLNNDGSLDNPSGVGGWVPNATFTGAANTPEPGTVTLFVTFLGILAAKGRFRRRPSPSA